MNPCLKQPIGCLRIPQTLRTLFVGFAIATFPSLLKAADFAEGLKAYEEGRYAESTQLFQRSLESQETAAIRHNLALSLYQEGRPTEALWQLERALQLQPFNRSYQFKIRALRQQMALPPPLNPWWLSAANMLSSAAWIWIASISFWLLLAALSLPRIAGRRPHFSATFTVVIGSIFFVISLASVALQKSNEITGTILADAPIPLRHAPASAAPEAGQARPGERARQLDQYQDFLKIKTEAGLIGWIEADALKKL